ncbi:MAG: DUF58 domain-containing protein [Patescibacteria group bacterium]
MEEKIRLREILLRKIREAPLEILQPLKGTQLWGAHRSRQISAGFDFDQHRSFEEGEDPRFIDWKIFGKTGELYVKKFRAEKEAPLFLLVDLTPSMFGGANRFFDFCTLKCEAAFILSAAFNEYARRAGDPIGYCLIGNNQNYYFPPQKEIFPEGLEKIWELIWKIQRDKRQPPLRQSFLEVLKKMEKEYDQSSIIIIISDLGETFLKERMKYLQKSLCRLGQNNFLFAAVTRTSFEYETPKTKAAITFRSANGAIKQLFFNSAAERTLYQKVVAENRLELNNFFIRENIAYAFLKTNDNLLIDLEKNLNCR